MLHKGNQKKQKNKKKITLRSLIAIERLARFTRDIYNHLVTIIHLFKFNWFNLCIGLFSSDGRVHFTGDFQPQPCLNNLSAVWP